MNEKPLAILEFPHGHRIFMGQDRRWYGDEAELAELTNRLMDIIKRRGCRLDWVRDIVHELAHISKAKIIWVEKKVHPPLGPGETDGSFG
jgi:hypothetical protein